MDENREIKYKIMPKFNLIYELGMPTGRKIRTAIFFIIIFLIATIAVFVKAGNLTFANYEIFKNIKVEKLLLILCIVADVVTVIRLVGTIIFQKIQYDHVTYTFYDHMMVYEDDFLNQHRKNIEYKNIKEVEIRRTIWDRLLNYGVIIVYTNADNDRNNGLVIYSIRDPKSHYNIIDKLIHNTNTILENKVSDVKENSNLTQNNNEENSNVENKDIPEGVQDNINNGNVTQTIQKEDEGALKLEPDIMSETPEEDFKNNLRNINK